MESSLQTFDMSTNNLDLKYNEILHNYVKFKIQILSKEVFSIYLKKNDIFKEYDSFNERR